MGLKLDTHDQSDCQCFEQRLSIQQTYVKTQVSFLLLVNFCAHSVQFWQVFTYSNELLQQMFYNANVVVLSQGYS